MRQGLVLFQLVPVVLALWAFAARAQEYNDRAQLSERVAGLRQKVKGEGAKQSGFGGQAAERELQELQSSACEKLRPTAVTSGREAVRLQELAALVGCDKRAPDLERFMWWLDDPRQTPMQLDRFLLLTMAFGQEPFKNPLFAMQDARAFDRAKLEAELRRFHPIFDEALAAAIQRTEAGLKKYLSRVDGYAAADADYRAVYVDVPAQAFSGWAAEVYAPNKEVIDASAALDDLRQAAKSAEELAAALPTWREHQARLLGAPGVTSRREAEARLVSPVGYPVLHALVGCLYAANRPVEVQRLEALLSSVPAQRGPRFYAMARAASEGVLRSKSAPTAWPEEKRRHLSFARPLASPLPPGAWLEKRVTLTERAARIKKLTRKGDDVLVSFHKGTVKSAVFECWGSTRVSHLRWTAAGAEVVYEEDCRKVESEKVKVEVPDALVPADQAAHLKKGHWLEYGGDGAEELERAVPFASWTDAEKKKLVTVFGQKVETPKAEKKGRRVAASLAGR